MKTIFQKPLILDGAMGTELTKKGIKTPLPLWSAIANEENYNEVVDIHKCYIDNGCNIITTNTFRTTERTYKKAGYKNSFLASNNSSDLAIKAANEARKNHDTLIAYSIAPLEDCYEPDNFPGQLVAFEEYHYMIKKLNNKSIDIILFETMGNIKEIETLLSASNISVHKKWLSIVLKSENELLDGSSINKAISLAKTHSIDTFLINCTTVDILQGALKYVKSNWNKDWGVYPNVGKNMPEKDGFIKHKHNNKEISNFLKMVYEDGARVIGACCGSTPDTISNIVKTLERN
jgi:homocysteine S-methyltransferase